VNKTKGADATNGSVLQIRHDVKRLNSSEENLLEDISIVFCCAKYIK